MKRRILLSIITAAAIVIQGAALPVFADETDDFGEIAEKAGNYEMKKYGQSLQSGGAASVKDTVPEGSGTTYYIDSASGDDANDGKSEGTAWRTIEKVNSQEFEPGDRILFKAGGEWIAPESDGGLNADIDDDEDGRPDVWLNPKGSGTEDDPIIIGAYGEGELPKLEGAANVNSVLAIEDEQYWDISNLDISNRNAEFDYTKSKDADNAKLMGDLRGVYIYGQSFSEDGAQGGVIDGFNIHDLYVHDVTGFVYWGGSPRDRNYPGVYGMMGQDASKRTGGIIFEAWKPTTGKDNPITFNNVTLENNVIWNTSFGGICIKQWEGDGHTAVNDGDFHVPAVAATNEAWGKREGAVKDDNGQYVSDAWHPHTNITLRNNFVSQKGMEYGCNTIRLASVQGALLEHNVCANSGTCAIELDYIDDAVVQYNEIYDTEKRMGGADNNAIDTDYRATNSLIQYNYVYNNGDGILLCGKDFSTAVYRYNIVANSGAEDYYIALDGEKGYNYVYNNLFLNTVKTSRFNFLGTVGGENYNAPLNANNPLYVYNNTFYNACDTSTGVSFREHSSIDYSNNSYYGSGIQSPASDTSAVTDKPYFAGEINDDELFDASKDIDLSVFKITDKSPLIGSGKEFELPEDFGYGTTYAAKYLDSGVDMFGSPMKSGKPDIGINEYAPVEGGGIIRGRVVDEYGEPLEGAAVTAKAPEAGSTEPEADYEIGVTDGDMTDGTIGVSVVNNLAEAANAALILAVYDGGTLVYSDVQNTELKPGGNNAVFEGITAEGAADPEIKIFLWDSLNGMKPLDTISDTEEVPGAARAVTDENGYYSFGEMKAGEYTISASKSGYADSEEKTHTLAGGAVDDLETIALENTATTGTVEGKITCAGAAAAGVTVTANNGGESVSTTTNEDGTYSLTAPYDEGYTLTVSGDGYITQSRSGITIQKGKTLSGVNFGIQSSAAETHTYAVKDNFDDYAEGALSSDTWGTNGTGSATVAADNGNNYLCISKSGGNSFGVYNKNDANLGVTDDNESGIITLGARVMRTTGTAQISMFSFNKSDWDSSNPMRSSNTHATFAMSNGNLFSHYLDANGASSSINAGTYQLNKWHKIWIVANMNTHTYDFYMDDNTAPVIINQQMRCSTPKDTLDRFLFYSNASGDADMCLDYFYACTGVQLDDTAVPYPVYDGIGTGTLSGVVSDSSGTISDATVTLTDGDDYNQSTTTDSSGNYRFTDIPSAKGYTLTVTKDDYRDASVSGINISNDSSVTQNVTLQTNETVYYINEDFNSYETGMFDGGVIWTVLGTAENYRTITVEDDAEDNGNKYLKLDKKAASNTDSSLFGIYNTTNTNISGSVTIEARVKRTKATGQYNQFSMYSFNSSKFSTTSPQGNNTTLTFYMLNNTINTHAQSGVQAADYIVDQWYDLKIEANFNTGMFDFYVDDVKTLENQSFKNNTLTLDKFLIYSNSAMDCDLYLDYFRVYS